jgi:hypothetical protein
VGDALDPAAAAALRLPPRRANDKSLARATGRVANGRARALLPLPDGVDADVLVVKAWTVSPDVRQAAVVLGRTSNGSPDGDE